MSVQVRANCELCRTEAASFYCDSDAAFLCSSCDHKVHSANFLFARHLRHPICHLCHSLHGGTPFSGPTPPLPLLCPSCSPKDPATTSSSSSSSSSSSACISTSDSRRREVSIPERSSKGIFVNWCRRLGIGERTSSVVTRACRVMRSGWSTVGSSHPRFCVCLAASFWFGMRMCGPGIATWRNLKGLAEMSSVPAKLIAVVESKVEFALTANARRTRRNINNNNNNNNNNNIGNGREGLDLEEGWAESSI